MRLDSTSFRDFIKAFEQLPDEEKKEAIAFADAECGGMRFVPNPGPQTEAYYSLADELYFGGAAGPGKTTFLCGLALNEHYDIHLFRREGTQLRGIVKELTRMLGGSDGLNAQLGIWRLASGQTIELAGIKDEADKEKWQGRAADLKGFDEICHFTRSQYRFIIGWNRTTRKDQRCRVIATGNPPLSVEGLWVIKEWAAWLDPTYSDPAKPGELRWPVRHSDDEDDNEIFFRTQGEAIEHLKTLRTAPRDYDGKIIAPRSRTFIPGELSDNPDLMRAGYSAVIEAMPKELREALQGSFAATLEDQDFQVIQTSWIMAAQERWKSEGWREYTMTAMGFDPAGGGKDAAVLCWRHGGWYAPFVSETGKQTADGSLAAANIIRYRRDAAPVVVDAGGGAGNGFGGTTLMRLKDNGIHAVGFNGASPSTRRPMGGAHVKIKFANKRAEAWWAMREALDPDQEGGSAICLPPDPELRADLAAPTYDITAKGLLIESKDELRKRLGRSPGKGDACVMCLSEGNLAVRSSFQRSKSSRPSQANVGYQKLKSRRH